MSATSGGGQQGKKSGKALAEAIQEIATQSAPARNEYFRNLSAATAGLPQGIPAAQTAYTNALGASDTHLKRMAAQYQQAGVDPVFTKSALDQASMQGRTSAEDARQAITAQFLGQTPSAVLGTTAQGQQGLLASAQRGYGITAAQQAQNTQLAGAGAAAIGTIIAAFL